MSIRSKRERYCYGETISTAFVESTVNQVMSKRMAKRPQMRWTRVLDGTLRRTHESKA